RRITGRGGRPAGRFTVREQCALSSSGRGCGYFSVTLSFSLTLSSQRAAHDEASYSLAQILCCKLQGGDPLCLLLQGQLYLG
ncbi:hypothetical protein GOODEAATRI_033893, partial [Goodea atripinnis]